MFLVAPHQVCLCEWTVKWAPEVQAALGVQGSFGDSADALLLGEVVLAVPLIVLMAFGRWGWTMFLLALAAGLPFALFLGLFGLDLGMRVLEEGEAQLYLLCATVLVPAAAVGGFARLVWFAIRAYLLRAPAGLRA